MKTVYLKGRSRGEPIHSLYRELADFPPDNYNFIIEKMNLSKPEQKAHSLTSSQQMIIRINNEMYKSVGVVGKIWRKTRTVAYFPVKRFRDFQFRSLPEAHADIVYCAGQLLFTERPWVVDVELANTLVRGEGGGQIRLLHRFVEKCLSSKSCKKIIPWSNWAKRTLYRSLDCNSFKEKIETVHLGMRSKNFTKNKADDNLRLLFVGSINQANVFNFERKGGIEAIEAFLELSKKYDRLELVIRSWVPPEIKARYSTNRGIKIIDSPLSESMLAKLYVSSDICLFPSHLNLGMAILEAMSYELPVIANRIFDVPEAVEDMKTGLLLEPIQNLKYYAWNGSPMSCSRNFLEGIRAHRLQIVSQIVEKTSLLIENAPLMRQLGRQARASIDEGKFSIKNRNAQLKRIFDESLSAN